MPKHGLIILYVHGNQKARQDGQPASTLTQLLNYEVPESDARSGIGSCGGSGVTRLSAYACARASSVT